MTHTTTHAKDPYLMVTITDGEIVEERTMTPHEAQDWDDHKMRKCLRDLDRISPPDRRSYR